jgi:hypothetical protein
MARTNIYMQARHTLVIDGVPVQGFAEGDFLQVKIDGNAAERTKGGDGPAMNISTHQGGNITISLLPVSPALGTLYGIREAQRSNPRMFSVVIMSGTEEIITAAGCAFGDLPQFATGGPTQSARQFSLECLEIKMDTSAVESILGGFIGGLL